MSSLPSSASLADFLRSWVATERVLLLKREAESPPPADPSGSRDDSRRRRAAENSARLALLLARSFSERAAEAESASERSPGGEPKAGARPGDWCDRGTASLRLEDFRVAFELEAAAAAPTASTANSTRIPESAVGRVRLLDVSLAHTPDPVRPSPGEGRRPSRLGQMLGSLLYSVFAPGKSLPENIFDTSLDGKQTNCHVESGKRVNSPPDGSRNSPRGPPRSRSSSRSSSKSSTSKGSAKAARAANSSPFSVLADATSLPAAARRLLSDLTRAGADSSSGVRSDEHGPFASFDEVLADLEQMVDDPALFLHDDAPSSSRGPDGGGTPAPPAFGRALHGRKGEVARMLKVAVEMERSDRGGEPPEDESNDDHLTNNNDRARPKVVHFGARPAARAVFVAGTAGCGKSALVRAVGDHLSQSGWFVARGKFERTTEHASRGVVGSMFDWFVSQLAEMKEGEDPRDAEYVRRGSDAAAASIGKDGLARLATFLPGLRSLFDDLGPGPSAGSGGGGAGETAKEPFRGEAHPTPDQLVFALVALLEAFLEPGRLLLVCADDLQWAAADSLSLLTEVLIRVGGRAGASRRFLFVGLYRDNEIAEDHPFAVQCSRLRTSGVNASEIKLSGLSKDDVVDMLMMTLRLPRRMVEGLADTALKKTAGHTLFLVQWLNSLVAKSIISYSVSKRRYDWDLVEIDCIQTGANVAELLASNFETLPNDLQRTSHVLSCFGIQTDNGLQGLLEGFQHGVVASIEVLVEKGILDRAGPLVVFAHDLIQQAVYENMSPDQRQTLHLDLGLFLGKTARTDVMHPLTQCIGNLRLGRRDFYAGRGWTSPLVAIACDQINSAGPDATHSETQKLRFAEWNLSAGKEMRGLSDFRAALYYFTNGILFLGEEDGWHSDPQLCLELHNGVVSSCFALEESEDVLRYVQEIVNNVSFQDTLEAQHYALRSMLQLGKSEECINLGIKILRQLGFDIPPPSKESIFKAMMTTNTLVSQYSQDQILDLCDQSLDDLGQRTVSILSGFYAACYSSHSPYLPLVTYEMVKFSLLNGITPEATTPFAFYSVLKVKLEENHREGRYWAEVVRSISKKKQSQNNSNAQKFDLLAEFVLCVTIDIWFQPPRDIASKLLDFRQNALKLGGFDYALMSLDFGWRYNLLGGEKLSVIQRSSRERMKIIAEHSSKVKSGRKSFKPYSILDSILLVDLTGNYGDLEGMLCDIKDIQGEAESNDLRALHHVHIYNMMLGFWRKDFLEAEKSSHDAWTVHEAAKISEMILIYHTFFSGLIAFHLYRETGDDKRLKEGSSMMDTMRKWTHHSMAVFENKWLLLKAEYLASFQGGHDARQFYEASIKAARESGNIHELGLAYELAGDHAAAHGCESESKEFYNNAFVSYTQWGAHAVAERLSDRHNLDKTTALHTGKAKHSREWD